MTMKKKTKFKSKTVRQRNYCTSIIGLGLDYDQIIVAETLLTSPVNPWINMHKFLKKIHTKVDMPLDKKPK